MKSFSVLALGMMAMAMVSCSSSSNDTSGNPFAGSYKATAMIEGMAPVPVTVTVTPATGSDNLLISAAINVPVAPGVNIPVNISNFTITKEVIDTTAGPSGGNVYEFYGAIDTQSVSVSKMLFTLNPLDMLTMQEFPLQGLSTGGIEDGDGNAHAAYFGAYGSQKEVAIYLESADTALPLTIAIETPDESQ